MLKIHLYGKLRKISNQQSASSESIVKIAYRENETIKELVRRLGLSYDDIGEIFVNHRLSDFNTIIPSDSSRIGLFEEGMYLIDGGLYMHFEDNTYEGTSVTKKEFSR